jgi:hypothetical protein
MGAGQSIPSTLSRDKVFELTRDTRGMMDVLLDYMLKEITVRDFVALSNPTECKKYVIFMANNLYKHFYELKIVPIKEKTGVIAFRPVKELVNPPEGEESERQSLCLTLAYFYTRIFQIYGALALTVIDDSKFMMESGIVPMYGDTTQKGLLPPGYRQYVSSGGNATVSTDLTGGSIPAASLGNFNFIRSFLYEEKDESKGFLTRYSGEGSSKGEIYFLPKIQDRDEYGRPIITDSALETKLQKGLFFIGYTGGKKYATLECYSKIEGIGGDTKFIFGKFKYYKKDGINPDTIELGSDILPIKNITIQRERPNVPRSSYVYTIKGSDTTITDFFNKALSKVVIYLKGATEGTTDYSTGTSGIIISETGTAEELRLARIVQNLTKTKPLGHCLARALQLLQTLPLKGEPAVSHICKAKFFEQTTTTSSGTKTTSSRSGIPEPGASLDDSPGLAALSQLFYDTVLIGSPRIIIGTTPKPGQDGKSSLQQYIEFMKTMGRLFGDQKFSGTPSDDTIKAGLKGIKNNRDNLFCKDLSGNLTVPPNVVRNVYDIVNQLYQTQVRHAAQCGNIMKLLFNIQRDKSSGRYRISLSDNIVKNGFPEIERINYQARQLLVNYYSKCEMTYLQGVKIVLDTSPEAIAARRRRAGTGATTGAASGATTSAS